MKKVLILFSLLSASIIFAQKADLSFLQFRLSPLNNNFKPVFTLSSPAALVRTECNFAISGQQRKPMFCRMEDKLCNKFNVWLQLRAGSDQDYRKMAFPQEVNKKGSTLIN
jgi:hypothetical protein